MVRGDASQSFQLNIQVLSDALEEHLFPRELHLGLNKPCLTGVRHYRTTPILDPSIVYFLRGDNLPAKWPAPYLNLIILGDCDDSQIPGAFSWVQFSSTVDGAVLFSLVQDIFDRYADWDMALQRALSSDAPFEEMAQVSLPILKNPIFIHDSDFYILACPWIPEGMAGFDRDERTGRRMVLFDTLNTFKFDAEYTHSLSTHGPTMFYNSPNGYRILYLNLWYEGRYEGRICVNELRRSITDGDYLCLDYLGQIICQHIARYNVIWSSFVNEIDPFISRILSGEVLKDHEMRLKLGYLHWHPDDDYLCIRLQALEYAEGELSPIGVISYIEAQIRHCHAFPYAEGITVIVNLTLIQASTSAISSKLATVMREGLYRIGLSNPVTGFSHLPKAYQQANIALGFSIKSDSMIWSHGFREYALDFFLETASQKLPPERLCPEALLTLRAYDAQHHTSLYETLGCYLENERNVTRTARALFIHRSTLLYRLSRIEALTHLDLEDPQLRLHLELSYLLLSSTD